MDAMVQQRGDNAESLSKTRYHQKNKQQAKMRLLVRTYLYTKTEIDVVDWEAIWKSREEKKIK